ncbi:MAG: hypothetical protein PQJ60_14285 [Spirochaetales bacterium]|nr:hypothetical protein [Spirochaetales bacterium]
MQNILISLALGLGAALIDTIPMFLKKLNPLFVLSAFLFWLAAGLLIPQVGLTERAWLNGGAVALILVIPLLPLIYLSDRSALVQVVLTTVVLGGLVGFGANRLIG